MSAENIVKRSRAERPIGKTDWNRLRELTDTENDAAIEADPDAPAATPEWLSKAVIVTPLQKQPVSIRLDADVLEHFRSQGRGYQSRINAILRTVMEHEKAER